MMPFTDDPRCGGSDGQEAVGPRLGSRLHALTLSGAAPVALSWEQKVLQEPGHPYCSSTSATVRPSTPAVRDPVLPATRSNAKIAVA